MPFRARNLDFAAQDSLALRVCTQHVLPLCFSDIEAGLWYLTNPTDVVEMQV